MNEVNAIEIHHPDDGKDPYVYTLSGDKDDTLLAVRKKLYEDSLLDPRQVFIPKDSAFSFKYYYENANNESENGFVEIVRGEEYKKKAIDFDGK